MDTPVHLEACFRARSGPLNAGEYPANMSFKATFAGKACAPHAIGFAMRIDLVTYHIARGGNGATDRASGHQSRLYHLA